MFIRKQQQQKDPQDPVYRHRSRVLADAVRANNPTDVTFALISIGRRLDPEPLRLAIINKCDAAIFESLITASDGRSFSDSDIRAWLNLVCELPDRATSEALKKAISLHPGAFDSDTVADFVLSMLEPRPESCAASRFMALLRPASSPRRDILAHRKLLAKIALTHFRFSFATVPEQIVQSIEQDFDRESISLLVDRRPIIESACAEPENDANIIRIFEIAVDGIPLKPGGFRSSLLYSAMCSAARQDNPKPEVVDAAGRVVAHSLGMGEHGALHTIRAAVQAVRPDGIGGSSDWWLARKIPLVLQGFTTPSRCMGQFGICQGLVTLGVRVSMASLCARVGGSIVMTVMFDRMRGIIDMPHSQLHLVLGWSSNEYTILDRIPRAWLSMPVLVGSETGGLNSQEWPISYLLSTSILSKRDAEWYLDRYPEKLNSDPSVCHWYRRHIAMNEGCRLVPHSATLVATVMTDRKIYTGILFAIGTMSDKSPLSVVDAAVLSTVVKLAFYR